MKKQKRCAICGCLLSRVPDTYGTPTVAGRSHLSKHHYVAERFFGRSKNRPGTKTVGIFTRFGCPWEKEVEKKKRDIFCFECHEELLHNPVLLPGDISRFAELVRVCGLSEDAKPRDRARIAKRVILLHEAIARGLEVVLEQGCAKKPVRRKRARQVRTARDTAHISE